MANVLPTHAQKKVWAMYRSRLVLVTSLVLLGLAIAGALTLFPSYVALHVAAPSAIEGATAGETDKTDAAALQKSKFLISELRPLLVSTSSPMTIVESALVRKPSGVRIMRIIYTRGPEEGRITLIGSGTRDQVSAYKDALTNSGAFTGVAVPVGALVGSEGGAFSIVLAGQF